MLRPGRLGGGRYLRAHHISQLLQVVGGEVPVVPVAPLHIFVDAMDVESECLEQLGLEASRS